MHASCILIASFTVAREDQERRKRGQRVEKQAIYPEAPLTFIANDKKQ